ncbi:hypothetical protein VOLCADRAFT_90235 [Volvox carteri f. nagariensis]|uniref:DUF155 domain-containing protein n=1 Tax=Volvox carteri f. nagariensis TaxID=3068 RepID=D8TTU1_VOLCA|nr:uncharacterized protein VOLCADRAFT_90235 [Volvox carteri f. nagariensis]EFJ48922.1 hypothetical protein VOLCADRAFT_90235 [Volvox carteri f. nagariensis]|eukprot:XP_002949819.1 hypothetical protein VOLCADRAFT_90235 [Volvox carteri f. nagariensis]
MPVQQPLIATTRSSLDQAAPKMRLSSSAQTQYPIRASWAFVPLPLDSSRGASPGRAEEEATLSEIASVAPGTSGRARITVYCVAESLDRDKLESLIRIKHPTWETHRYEDVIHARLPGPMALGGWYGSTIGGAAGDEAAATAVMGMPSTSGASGLAVGAALGPPDVFFFDELATLRSVAQSAEQNPLTRYEKDEFTFNISVSEPPHIQNDTITINRRQATDYQVRLAISHALAQSTKLSVYEEEVVALVEESRHLPQDLADHGRVSMSTKKLTQLIGKVFLQSSTLNLLSSVMDTPEFFWSAPDQLQHHRQHHQHHHQHHPLATIHSPTPDSTSASLVSRNLPVFPPPRIFPNHKALYERACEYLELDTRAEVLNARFQVLQEMLDMLRDHKNNSHAARLEWIIIWLLMVDVILMLFQLLSLFGLGVRGFTAWLHCRRLLLMIIALMSCSENRLTANGNGRRLMCREN